MTRVTRAAGVWRDRGIAVRDASHRIAVDDASPMIDCSPALQVSRARIVGKKIKEG